MYVWDKWILIWHYVSPLSNLISFSTESFSPISSVTSSPLAFVDALEVDSDSIIRVTEETQLSFSVYVLYKGRPSRRPLLFLIFDHTLS